jgi:hypothetical protein
MRHAHFPSSGVYFIIIKSFYIINDNGSFSGFFCKVIHSPAVWTKDGIGNVLISIVFSAVDCDEIVFLLPGLKAHMLTVWTENGVSDVVIPFTPLLSMTIIYPDGHHSKQNGDCPD